MRGIAGTITGHEIFGKVSTPKWNSDYLCYSVCEPFPSNTTGTSLVFGEMKGSPSQITSQMPENGVIFSDGIEQDFLKFHSSIKAKISVVSKRDI